MKEGFTIEFDDSLAGQKYYRQAIKIFNASIAADPTNLRLATYLSDLYFKEQKFDSALIWAQRLFPFDSIEFFKDNKISISSRYRFIGKCFLYEGDLKNGSKYFQMALNVDPTQVIILTQTLSDIADQFFFRTIPIQINKLKSIDPCRYSIDILHLGQDIGKKEKYATKFLFSNDKIKDREKTCL